MSDAITGLSANDYWKIHALFPVYTVEQLKIPGLIIIVLWTTIKKLENGKFRFYVIWYCGYSNGA